MTDSYIQNKFISMWDIAWRVTLSQWRITHDSKSGSKWLIGWRMTWSDAWLWVNESSIYTKWMCESMMSHWLCHIYKMNVRVNDKSMTHPYIQNECVSQWWVIDSSIFTKWMWEWKMSQWLIHIYKMKVWVNDESLTLPYLKNECESQW